MRKSTRYIFSRYNTLGAKNYIVLGLLIGIPLFIVGFLAIKTLHLEYKGIESAREKTSLHFLKQIDNDIQLTVNTAIQQLTLKTILAISDNPIESPRKLVLIGDMGFITVYKGEQRIFPPEDSPQMLSSERNLLSLLKGLLFNARQHLKNDDTFKTLVSITPDSPLQSIFYCQSLASGYDICLLSQADELQRHLQHIIDQYHLSHPQWNLSLTGPNGLFMSYPNKPMTDKPYYSHRLGFPLQEWQLKGQLIDEPDSTTRWSLVLFIVVISLLLSWISFVLFFYRQQQSTLKKNIKRSELAAKLSHELHTPLANLALYADLLKRRASNVNDVLKYADIIQSETDRLSRVSSIAIAVAQGEEENIKQDPGYPDVLIETLLSRFTALLNKRHCKVLFTGNVPQAILFDRTALESIVLQLLDNACKYGGEGEIYLTTTLHKDTLLITIRDYGSGIPDNEQALIFEANYRGKHLDQKGFGLGLAAVRHLARLHGGDIHVENAKPGAKFVVSLKVRPA